MNKLRTFWATFKKSLDVSYYREVVLAPFSFSLKYFFFLLFIVSFLQIALFSINLLTLLPKAPQFVKTLQTRVKTAYPANLVITVRNGILSTNVAEPYYYDVPEFKDEKGDYKHFITIDTKASADDYKSYQTMVLVTQKGIVYPDREHENVSSQKIFLFDKDQNIVINKSKYDTVVNKYLPYTNYIPTILVIVAVLGLIIVPFFTTFFIGIATMIYLLAICLVMWGISLLFKNNLGYQKVYQIALHAVTVPLLATTILTLFNSNIPFLYTATLGLWMVIILSKIKGEQPEASQVA